MIKREIVRFFKTKYFVLGCLGLIAVSVIDFFPYIPPHCDMGLIAMIYYMTRHYGLFSMVASIFIALPCSCIVLEETSSGCYRNYMFRMGFRRYVLSRIAAALACSMCAVCISVFVYLAGYIVVHPKNFFLGNYIGYGKYFEDASLSVRLLFFISRFFFIGLYCCIWACVSLAACAWSNNRYIALGIGFCIENLLSILSERLIIPLSLSPKGKMTGDVVLFSYSTPEIIVFLLIYDSFLILLAGIIFAAGIKRRMAYV